MDIARFIELGVVSAAAAIVGSMLGLGGGVFLVPIFTLFFGVDQKLAIGASAIAVVSSATPRTTEDACEIDHGIGTGRPTSAAMPTARIAPEIRPAGIPIQAKTSAPIVP